ncbi:hypothetical protein C0J27_05540 [Candidatus Chromulinivorax destructor]|uniref:Uncharacterized protein n=2 Tax=Candidatus Chromulinivorax destructor TaxID=2066483 RepID=A0A345ZCZ7_9BACT|nr:hypothetical protein C0J27_05540 [Candidatus Chromulinivorax destructor]
MVLSKSDKDCQIEQLKNTQHDKEKEIALIIKAIDEKENLIDSIFLRIQNIVPHVIKHLDEEQIQSLDEELDFFQSSLQDALIHQKSLESLLSHNFIDRDNDSGLKLKRIKYLITRYTLEYTRLNKLIQKYEQCLQKWFVIDYQLNELQK